MPSTLSKQSYKSLQQLVSQTKAKLLIQKLCWALVFSVVFGAVIYWLSQSTTLAIASILALMLIKGITVLRSNEYAEINTSSLLLHLNRKFRQCEESAQLALQNDDSLSLLQKLQKRKIMPIVESLLLTDLRQYLPTQPIKKPLLFALLLITIFTLIEQKELLLQFSSSEQIAESNKSNELDQKPSQLSSVNISIIPPLYTKLGSSQSSELDITLIAGSTVKWRLVFVNLIDNDDMFLQLNNEQKLPLSKQKDGSYLAQAKIQDSGVYQIIQAQQVFGDIHTIAVTQDKRPSIRFIAPTSTITEVTRDAEAEVLTTVHIDDDFGLAKVQIFASIASGSGEGVKFRDTSFSFDSEQSVDGKKLFHKLWKLRELGMQPGDELYFSIQAWDNREPNSQQSKSSRKIIRWLEDEQEAVLADGVLIDFIPEYFKSQRQIIIETEQLIADQKSLSKQQYDITSRELGMAQNFLKQKYGQFLGDEFESGTLESMEAGPDIEHDEHEESTDDTHSQEEKHEHEHHSESVNTSADKSGYAQIIEQFGHAHGEADDGNFIKKGIPSPTLLMKRAIGNMWNAELHLQLSQPERALPFENKALNLLNRAKQAERVYVKRLGFEPPPVSEKRRYQGNLSDILSYERNEQQQQSSSPTSAFKRLLKKLSQSQSSITSHELQDQDLQLIQQVKDYFSSQLSGSPEDIAFVATLQKVQQKRSLSLNDCQNCLTNLQLRLWQLLPPTVAAPLKTKPRYSEQNNMLRNYNTFLQQQSAGEKP